MKQKIPLHQRIARLFFGEVSSLMFALGMLALALGVGFIITDSRTENYDLINSHASQLMWGIIYICYSLLRMGTALYRVPSIYKLIVCFIGLTIWLVLFLSFTVYDPSTLRPTELMLLLPVVVEFWFTLSAVNCMGALNFRRSEDASR